MIEDGNKKGAIQNRGGENVEKALVNETHATI
jgi:hypothetical protein